MDVRKLNEKFGAKMAIWGGVAVEKLIDGTPEDVRANVRYAMENTGSGAAGSCWAPATPLPTT
jgi:hypothetical protein